MRATARCARGAHCAGRARVAVAIASRASMSRKGNAWDNAVAESFFSSLKNELVHHCRFADQAEARGAVFAWIEGFYNRRRIHSTLDFVSPSDYEARYQLRSVTCPENRG